MIVHTATSTARIYNGPFELGLTGTTTPYQVNGEERELLFDGQVDDAVLRGTGNSDACFRSLTQLKGLFTDPNGEVAKAREALEKGAESADIHLDNGRAYTARLDGSRDTLRITVNDDQQIKLNSRDQTVEVVTVNTKPGESRVEHDMVGYWTGATILCASESVSVTDRDAQRALPAHLQAPAAPPTTQAAVVTENPTTRKAIESMLMADVPLTDAEKERLVSLLSVFPSPLVEQAAADGLKIYILADYPQPPGKIRPTDLGALGPDGSDTLDMPTSDGGTQKVSINQAIVGAFLPDKNAFYLFHSLLGDQSPQLGEYTARHEFTHALAASVEKHHPGFMASVQTLYDACQKNQTGHEFIDAYAATNPDEYLAVSSQSYLTQRPLTDETGKFDISADYNANLRKHDPAMYEFVEKWLAPRAS